MRSVTGGETRRFFIGMKARNITVKTGNLEIHAKSSDKKTEVNQFLVQKILRIT